MQGESKEPRMRHGIHLFFLVTDQATDFLMDLIHGVQQGQEMLMEADLISGEVDRILTRGVRHCHLECHLLLSIETGILKALTKCKCNI